MPMDEFMGWGAYFEIEAENIKAQRDKPTHTPRRDDDDDD